MAVKAAHDYQQELREIQAQITTKEQQLYEATQAGDRAAMTRLGSAIDELRREERNLIALGKVAVQKDREREARARVEQLSASVNEMSTRAESARQNAEKGDAAFEAARRYYEEASADVRAVFFAAAPLDPNDRLSPPRLEQRQLERPIGGLSECLSLARRTLANAQQALPEEVDRG